MGTILLEKHQEPTSICRSLSSSRNPATSQRRKISVGIMADKMSKMGSLQEEQSLLSSRQPFLFRETLAVDTRGSGEKIIFGEETLQPKNRSPWVSTRSKIHEKPDTQTGHNFEAEGAVDMVKAVVPPQSHVPRHSRTDENVSIKSSEVLKQKLWEVLSSAPSQSKRVLSSATTRGDANYGKEQNEVCDASGKGRPNLTDSIESDSEKPCRTINRPSTCSLTQKKRAPDCDLSKFQTKTIKLRRQSPSSKSKHNNKMGEKGLFSFDGQEVVGASKTRFAEALPKITNLQAETHGLLFSRKSAPSKSAQVIEKECPSKLPVKFPSMDSPNVSQRNSPGADLVRNLFPKNASSKFSPLEKGQNPSPPPLPALKTAGIANVSPKTQFCEGNLGPNNVDINRHGPVLQEAVQKLLGEPHKSHSCAPSQGVTGAKSQTDPLRVENTGLNKRKYATDFDGADKIENICSQLESSDAQDTDACDSPISVVMLNKIFLEHRMIESGCNFSSLRKSTSNLQKFSEEQSPLKSGSSAEEGIANSSMSSSSQSQCGPDNKNSIENSISLGMKELGEDIHDTKKNVQMPWISEPKKENREVDDAQDKGSGSKDHLFDGLYVKKLSFDSLCNKRSYFQDGSEEFNSSPLAFFEKSKVGETDESPGMEQLSDDSLSRSILHLTATFEQIKKKIKLHASKRTSDILSSLKDKIQLQLQGIESQIQADLKNFSSRASSRRKHLESTFHAQQEKLKVINKKFKEEVNRHLQECRVTLEELEAFRMESKGTIEKQRLLHRKLIMQMEEATEIQLNDAEQSMVAIQKVARKKMNGLKHLLEKVLDEGILGR